MYFEDYTPEPEFDIDYLTDTADRFEAAKEFAVGLQECLGDKWDPAKAEHCLEELCGYLGVPYTFESFTVEAKPCE